MIDITIDTTKMQAKVEDLVRELRLSFGDFRDFFLEFDAWLTTHLKSNYDREGPHWAPLAKSTRAARATGLKYGTAPAWHKTGGGWTGSTPTSYYRRTKPLRRVSDAHPIGQWTGKARKRALKKGKALRSYYVRDFRPDDFARDRLYWIHTGGPGRPPRPIYRQRVLEKEFAARAKAYANNLVSAVERAIEGLGPDISDRLSKRFL